MHICAKPGRECSAGLFVCRRKTIWQKPRGFPAGLFVMQKNKPGAAHNVCAVFMLDECIEGCIINAYLMNIYSDARKPANRPRSAECGKRNIV